MVSACDVVTSRENEGNIECNSHITSFEIFDCFSHSTFNLPASCLTNLKFSSYLRYLNNRPICVFSHKCYGQSPCCAWKLLGLTLPKHHAPSSSYFSILNLVFLVLFLSVKYIFGSRLMSIHMMKVSTFFLTK